MRFHQLHVAALLLAAACGPRDLPPPAELKSALFPPKGVIGGYDFGDSWEHIKANHDEVFEVRDDEFKQLRRDVGDNAGSNGYFLGFHLDGAGEVVAFDASINGKQQNAITVRALLDDIVAHFDVTAGLGTCTRPGTGNNSTNCYWENPGAPRVELHYFEMSDPISGSVQISIKPR